MNTTDTALEVRVLGQFSMLHSARPMAAQWPAPCAKELFLNLLSPQGDSVSRDRLCRALWRASASAGTEIRLAELIGRLNTFFMRECGIRPIIEKDGGLTLSETLVRLDARYFYQISREGLQHLAAGNGAVAGKFFRTALSLYSGPFLPEADSRIISMHRECLHSLYLAMERHVAKQRPGRTPGTARVRPETLAA